MITQDQLEKYLQRGEEWGFRRETGDPEYLGWILVSKRKPPILWPGEEANNPAHYTKIREEAERLSRTPYHVKIRELRRDVHESGEYEQPGDYRLVENFYFESLRDVEQFLNGMNLTLEHIQPRILIDAP